jgi:glycosyltransferase involved in cell wall biosynthesis
MMNDISVIIRTRNEEQFIGFAIQSCIDNFENPEIIIIDNNSTDDSIKIVNLFDSLDIKILKINDIDYTPGKAINMGINECSNETILVLSAHCQITKCNLQHIKKQLNIFKCVFGKQIPIYRGKKINTRYIWSHFSNQETINMFSTSENRYFLHNAFAFYAKSFITQNQFSEIYSSKEERYWANDIIQKNNKILYSPEYECNHFFTNNGATWKGVG